ncbi:MAG: NADH-quinone oxidoreductase subunit L [Candidatus Dadabacteria bacterium]|nr:MAG: NADH-quinone oxidoreductase subunit L [Candidatus Dadabacteria bacterium]
MHPEHIAPAVHTVSYLRWIPLLPLLGVLVHVFWGRRLGRAAVGAVACAVVGASFLVSVEALADLRSAGSSAILVDEVYRWIAAGDFSVSVTLGFDALSAVMCLVVTGVGFLIHVYSTGYMGHDPDYARYFAYLNLFTASMLILVLADSLPLMFVGWEGVGLCSYLLIGFWYSDPDKASAGKKAFIVNRIGDAGFVLGMALLFWKLAEAGMPTLRFAVINQHAAELGGGVALAGALLLFLGATGKSAQIPLFVWLPDAMAGPTPVSALIHAATMVTAGVYMVARLHGLYLAAPVAMSVVGTVGALTAVGAASVGIAQNDIKKVLAYSTISQLGYMFLGLGVGAFAAAIFHVVTHAFFKALLFLGAGSVIHALHEEQDIRQMGGLSRKMPVTSATFLVATLAIAGIPGLSGFFSKDEILASAFATGHYGLWALGFVGAGLTAFYMTRLLVLTFYGDFRGDDQRWAQAHESPPSMTFALVVLAVLAAAGGWIGVPPILGGSNRFGAFLAPVLGHHELHLAAPLEVSLMVASVAIAVAAMYLAWRIYRFGPLFDAVLAERASAVYGALCEAYYVDRSYLRYVAEPIVAGAHWLWRRVDVGVIDGFVNGLAAGCRALADSWRRWATGNVQEYALSIMVGVLALVAFMAAGLVR